MIDNEIDIETFKNNSQVNDLQTYIKSKQEENKKKLNIFRVLRLDNHEIRHSNFLAWLLNPRETHCLGDLFLDKFLRTALNNFGGTDYRNIEIKLEYQIDDNGRIDVLLFNRDFVCIVENKYGSQEHDEQCKRYKKFIESKSQFKNREIKKFIFLDLQEPEEEVLKNELNGYEFITYEQVKDILEDILSSKPNISQPVRDVIEQYIAILKEKYPVVDTETLMKSKEIYKQYKDVIDTICLCTDKKFIQNNVQKALDNIFNQSNPDIQHFLKNENDKKIIKFLPKKVSNIELLKFGDWSQNEDYIIALTIFNFKNDDCIMLEVLLSPVKDNSKENNKKDLIRYITNETGFEFNRSAWTSYKYPLLTKEEWLDCRDIHEIEAKILFHWNKFPLDELSKALNDFCNTKF